jgi:hypothetical protein
MITAAIQSRWSAAPVIASATLNTIQAMRRTSAIQTSEFMILTHACLPPPGGLQPGRFVAAASGRTKSATFLTMSGSRPPSAICFTIALPTTTASAQAATCRTCSGVEMPKPTATGRVDVAADFGDLAFQRRRAVDSLAGRHRFRCRAVHDSGAGKPRAVRPEGDRQGTEADGGGR